MRSTFPRPGKLEWIGYARKSHGELETPREARVEEPGGIDGEHHGQLDRAVTLIQAEHLEAGSKLAGVDVRPEHMRRNLVVSGINLLALKDQRFTVGEVVLEGTGLCRPCSRIEENLGPGGYNAMRGHGGITARVLRSGTLRLGDEVRHVAVEAAASES